jgi:hypothetical protein
LSVHVWTGLLCTAGHTDDQPCRVCCFVMSLCDCLATMLLLQAPRHGLTRPRGAGGAAAGGAAGGSGGRPGFVPPFVGKAIEHHTGGGAAGGSTAGGVGAGGEEGPLSARTLEMLGGGWAACFVGLCAVQVDNLSVCLQRLLPAALRGLVVEGKGRLHGVRPGLVVYWGTMYGTRPRCSVALQEEEGSLSGCLTPCLPAPVSPVQWRRMVSCLLSWPSTTPSSLRQCATR